MVEKKSSDDAKHSALGEIIIPLFGVLFTAYYFSTILDSPWTAQVNAVLVGSILLIISAIFFFRIFSSYKNGHSVFVFQYQQILSAIRSRQAVFIFITLGYLLLVEFIGYTFATVVFFFLSMSLLDNGRHLAAKFALSLIMAAVGYGIFIYLFETRLPEGIIEEFLIGVF
jgi:hypothetical protein